MSQLNRPNIFEYENYRLFLRDFYSFQKAAKPQFSFRFFSRAAGFRSPNFLKLVMDGARNLSTESIDKFGKALKLSLPELKFFKLLVSLNQSSNSEERKLIAEQLIRSKPFRKRHPLKEAEFRYYTHWYFIPIRELVALKDFREDPDWVAQKLNPPISAAEAKQALHELELLGLIRRTTGGRLERTTAIVGTSNEVSSMLIAAFHKEMMKKASESIDRVPRGQREISAVTIEVSKQTAEQIKAMIQRFRQEILEVAAADGGPDRIYQLNFQLFPLTRADEEKATVVIEPQKRAA